MYMDAIADVLLTSPKYSWDERTLSLILARSYENADWLYRF